jgi:hypothetical protein
MADSSVDVLLSGFLPHFLIQMMSLTFGDFAAGNDKSAS